jgi:hypothetical protein
MPKRIKRVATGQVVSEHVTGKPVPRAGGLVAQTIGKGTGTRDVRSVGRTVVDHVGRR